MNTNLIRGIKRWDLVAILLNGVIGAGIFGLPSKVQAIVGSYSLLAYLVCAFLILLIIMCFAEVGSRFKETGGPYIYAYKSFGPHIGFGIGWLVWLSRVTAFAALCNLLIDYLSFIYPAATIGITRIIIISLIVLGLTLINLLGVRKAAITINFFTIAKLIPLIVFIIWGLFYINISNFTFENELTFDSLSTSVLLLIFAFSGFEVGVIPTGEIRNPRKNIPFAMFTLIAVVVALYLLIQFVSIGTFPDLSTSNQPLAEASRLFMGNTGAVFITLGALVSITGTLNSTMLSGPRALFAIAEQGQFPKFFASVNPRFHTPHYAIIISGLVVLILSIGGDFISAVKISTVIRLITYAITSASLPILRRKSKDSLSGGFTSPFGKIISITALVLIALLFTTITTGEVLNLIAAIMIGFVLYLPYLIFKKRRK